MKQKKPPAPKIALALAGGGPLGAIYEIGALCALEESLLGLDFTRLHHYVGVSAGGFIAAGLANGLSPRELFAWFIQADASTSEAFEPAWLTKPAYAEYAQRAALLPGLIASALWRLAIDKKPVTQIAERLARVLPTGVFSNAEVNTQLAKLFSYAGRTNDFRQLKSRLTLVATNLDSGESAPFGSPGWDHIPISRAVQASSALPGLFPPVELDGSFYVDGALKKTLHATVALDEGIDLLLCLNPLVPFDATAPMTPKVMQRGLSKDQREIPRIVEGGLPAVLSQTFRSLIHSRLELGMKQYERLYPDTDIILIEPDHRDPEMYLANTFSYSQRRHLAEHAYQQTRQLLRSRKAGLSAKLEHHGIHINHAILDDRKRHLCTPTHAKGQTAAALNTLESLLDDLNHSLGLEAQRAARG